MNLFALRETRVVSSDRDHADELGRMKLVWRLSLLLLLCAQLAAGQSFLAPACTAVQACAPMRSNIAGGVTPTATNTCGQSGPEEFCAQLGSDPTLPAGECSICDETLSETAYGPERMVDAIPNTAWQSQTFSFVQPGYSDPGHVNVTFSFNKTFEVFSITVTFQRSRPDSLTILKSIDHGETFTPFQYFSNDCEGFYGEPTHDMRAADPQTALCSDEQSSINPTSGGEVEFDPLQFKGEDLDTNTELQEWVTATDIRLRLDRLNTFGDELFGDPNVLKTYFYSISDVRIEGRCKCNGHGSECALNTEGQLACLCNHNTEGTDCEQCQPFHKDKPWGRGAPQDAHVCIRCNCNDHSDECYFSEAAFNQSGSGGVCTGCRDNTDGQYCEQCDENFYRNPDPFLPVTAPSTCIPCDCDVRGTKGGTQSCQQEGRSEGGLGQCPCKDNVDLQTCSECKDEYYGLDSNNPEGCSECDCNVIGTVNGSRTCDKASGECPCKANVHLRTCGECKPGFFSFSDIHENGCLSCDCNLGGSLSDVCNTNTGDCACRPNVSNRGGRKTCDDPDPGFFCASIDHIMFEAEFTGGVFYSDADSGGRNYTGLGYARLSNGETADILAEVPFSGQYRVVIRYSTGDNSSVTLIRYTLRMLSCADLTTMNDSTIVPCSDAIPQEAVPTTCPPLNGSETVEILTVPAQNATAITANKFHCLVVGKQYRLTITPLLEGGSLLLDSAVLIPDVAGLKTFQDRNDTLKLFLDNQCIEAKEALSTADQEEDVCGPLKCSATFEIYNGSVACDCDSVGAVSLTCEPDTGQCPCKVHRRGRRCELCEPGRGGPDCKECNCDPLGSLSAVCGVDGQCFCKPGVVGQFCDQCRAGYYGFSSGKGCSLCNCHMEGASSPQCDLGSGECLCNPGVGGKQCDLCLPGFYGLGQSGCKQCDCDVNGTVRAVCDPVSGDCLCKDNVRPGQCSLCKKGHFGLLGDREKGCIPCQCNNLTSHCDLVTNLRRAVISLTTSPSTDFSLVNEELQAVAGSRLHTSDSSMNISVDLTASTSSFGVYLLLPDAWTRNLSSAYGFAQLRFTIQLNTVHTIPLPLHDVLLATEGELLHSAFLPNVSVSSVPEVVTVDLIGDRWQSVDSVLLDITDTQRLIRGVQSLAFRVGYSFVHQVSITELALEFFVQSDDSSLPLVEDQEDCRCPKGYSGFHCEMCAEGYKRNKRGRCKPCQCNGNSKSCITATGVCLDCEGNTTGEQCEACLSKHYRDPSDGQCKPCPCPGTDTESQFATDCSASHDGHVTCHDCREGHTGDRCEFCNNGYYGDPTGNNPRPCTTCECNNNIDPQNSLVCERLNGTCINCTGHTYGRECERCEPGYYGDAVVAKNCTECSHCVRYGVVEEVCEHTSGRCLCSEHVLGDLCDSCEDGYFNVTAGCGACMCNPTGTNDPSAPCNPMSGHCVCKPGVGGRDCDQCLLGFYNFTVDGCSSCECVETGSVGPACDDTGKCQCLGTVLGRKCDTCKDGYHNIEDGCISCHSCYGLVHHEYLKAESLYIRLVNILNQLEEGSTNQSLLVPKLIQSISRYREVLLAQLSRSMRLWEREMEATATLGWIMDSLDNLTQQSALLSAAVVSAGESTQQAEVFVNKSGPILSNLENTNRHLQAILRDAKRHFENAGRAHNRTLADMTMLADLVDRITNTSKEQKELVMQIFLRATYALSNATESYKLLMEAINLQNITRLELDQLNSTELTDLLRRSEYVLRDAGKEVPPALSQAQFILAQLQAAALNISSYGEIDILREEYENLLVRHSVIESWAHSLDEEDAILLRSTEDILMRSNTLLGESMDLDHRARLLLTRIQKAHQLSEQGYKSGQGSINETEQLLKESQQTLRDIREFQANLTHLLRLLKESREVAATVLLRAEVSVNVTLQIEVTMRNATENIMKAAVFSREAAEWALNASNLATETLINATDLANQAGELKTKAYSANTALETVREQVTSDKAEISALSINTTDVEDFSARVTKRLQDIQQIVKELTDQFVDITFVNKSEIDALSRQADQVDDILQGNEVMLAQVRAQQEKLDEQTEQMEQKYERLRQHRELLKKIKENIEDLDCESG